MKFSTVALLSLTIGTATAGWTRTKNNESRVLKGKKKKEKKGKAKKAPKGAFNRVSVQPICEAIDETCNDDTETVAEIVYAAPDGMSVYFSDSESEAVGAIDISDPSSPEIIGTTVSFRLISNGL